MRVRVLSVTLPFLLLPGLVSAQTKMSGSGRCAKPDIEHSIPVPDRPNHTFVLNQGKCVWTKPWEIAGVKSKEGVGTVSEEVTGDTARSREVFVDTMENGDQGFYRYEATTTLKEGKPQTSQGRWTLTGGTGKLKGIQGKGTCKATTFEADGGLTFECAGDYTLAAAKKP
jgi:hypothetical protein